MQKDRNYGIDLIKILSMFMVVTLHILTWGGVVKNSTYNGLVNLSVIFSVNNELGNLFFVLSVCAVDIFVICTGYVYAEKKFKISNLINLWIEVIFYSFLVTLVFYLFGYPVAKIQLIKSCFPLFSGQYWFFTAYFVMFLFIPWLNFIGKNKTLLLYTILISFILFSVITYFLGKDIFSSGIAYNFVWLCVLYLIGVYIKKYYNFNTKKISYIYIRCHFYAFFICNYSIFSI